MEQGFVNIGGELIGNALLGDIKVTQALNQHGWCEVVCRQTQDIRFESEKCLGKDLTVTTQDEDGNQVVVFAGFVYDVELEYEIFGSYRSIIRAVTRTWKMGLAPKYAYFKEKSLSDIANRMAGNAGLKASVQADDGRLLRQMQWAESDFEFLLRLAAEHGSWLRPTPDGFEIRNSFQATTVLEWRQEGGLRGFRTRGTLGPTSFGGAHYNFHEMKSQIWTNVKDNPQFFDSVSPLVNAVREQCESLPPGYVPDRSRVVALDEYEDLLKQTSKRALGASVVASGISLQPKLHPGDQIQIDGVLDAQGTYGLIQVTHHWTPFGYDNEFVCTPWQNYADSSRIGFKRCYGVVPARIVDHNDPKQMGRVKIQFFWQEDEPTEWVRMMTPHAGGSRGFMFMPEIGDEVVIAFEEGDPERPVVLGCMWNGLDTAPREDFWGEDVAPNDVKRIMTKSGTRFQIIDKKGKESVMFSTPNSVRIMLTEHSNETNRETLLLHTDLGDIILSAPNGRVHVHSKYYSREVGANTPI